MSTKHHYTPTERDYHDAYTLLRLMRRETDSSVDVGDYYDDSRNPWYWEYFSEFESLPGDIKRAARRSLSARGDK